MNDQNLEDPCSVTKTSNEGYQQHTIFASCKKTTTKAVIAQRQTTQSLGQYLLFQDIALKFDKHKGIHAVDQTIKAHPTFKQLHLTNQIGIQHEYFLSNVVLCSRQTSSLSKTGDSSSSASQTSIISHLPMSSSACFAS